MLVGSFNETELREASSPSLHLVQLVKETGMGEMNVGVQELKTRLSGYLRQVKAGQTIVITEHGRPVGRIVPAIRPLGDRLQAMAETGLIAWNGKKLKPTHPVVHARGKRTVAELVVENRE